MDGFAEFWLWGVLPGLGIVARATRLITTDRVPFGSLRAWAIRRPERTRTTPPQRPHARFVRRIRDRIDRLRGVDALLADGLHCTWCMAVWTGALVAVSAALWHTTLAYQLVCAAAWLSYLTGLLGERLH